MVSLLTTMAVLGLSVNLEPGTLVVFMILLRSRHASRDALSFVAGWMVSLAVVFIASYTLGRNQPHLDPRLGSTFIGTAELLGAGVLLWVAHHEWVRRDDPRTRDIPKTKGWLDRIGPKSAFIIGVWEQSWTVTMAAALVVVRLHPPRYDAVCAFLVFAACSLVAVAFTYILFMKDPVRTQRLLDSLKEFIAARGPKLFAIVAFIAAVGFSVDGVIQLLS